MKRANQNFNRTRRPLLFVMMPGLLLVVIVLLTTGVLAQDVPDLTPPESGDFDPETIEDIDLFDFPILPELTDHAQIIYERGQETGRDPMVFSKVGDSMTASESFLTGFGGDDYDLGEYADLQPMIDFFHQGTDPETELNTFNRPNYATHLGFSTIAALDPTWADTERCEPNETPLDCEFRVSNSAWALVMFGTNDVIYFDEPTFDYFLRTVILTIIEKDVVPIMYTFPERPENPESSAIFNQIVIKVARDYDLPLINLAVAVDPLENKGVDLDDPLHLTLPDDPNDVFVFNGETLQAGYTVRNLVTLQALNGLLGKLELIEELDSK